LSSVNETDGLIIAEVGAWTHIHMIATHWPRLCSCQAEGCARILRRLLSWHHAACQERWPMHWQLGCRHGQLPYPSPLNRSIHPTIRSQHFCSSFILTPVKVLPLRGYEKMIGN